MTPAPKELERRLLAMLCTDDDRVGRQEVWRCINDGVCSQLGELAWRNGLAGSLFDRVTAFSPEHAQWFTARRDNSKVPGFDNADTAAIQRECGAISRAFAPGGARAVVVKGASVARHYPPWLRRHQKDMDIAVPDLQAAFALAEVLQSRGFLQEALAVRMDAHGRLVGAASFVRPDLTDRQVMWCDVWIGVQPLATSKSIDLDAAFWVSLMRDADGLVPSPAQCLRILCAEVEERSTLLLKDVFDCRALLCAAAGSGVSTVLMEMPTWHQLQEACTARDDLMRSAFGRCGPELSPGASMWQPLPQALAIAASPPAEPAATQATLSRPDFVRFRPVAGDAGPLAIATHDEGIVLRTPIGCFVSLLAHARTLRVEP